MITVTEYRGQKVGVFGLGKAGEAAVAALAAGGAKVFKWDDSFEKNPPVYPQKTRNTKHYKYWDWAQLKALVLSPGVPLTHPKPHPVVELAKQHNVPVIGEVELLYRACPDATYIGITGTNGKSTTTALIGHILKESGVTCEIGGNLGVPALALEPLDKGGVYVLEMSSYQLDLMETVRFSVAVLLNITPDHLDRHGDMEGYVAAKKHIFDRQRVEDVVVVDAGIRQEELGIREAKIIKISADSELESGVYVKDGVLCDNNAQFDISKIISLTGKHNWQNAAAAYAVCRAVGVASDRIYTAMKSFGGLRHRLQLVATINGVRFVNDSKATNADATQNALAPYNNIYWILGGKAKAGGISSLGEYFPKITHAFLIGEAAEEFAGTLDGKVPYTHCGTLDVAVAKAAETAKSGGVVLLSPACASFDQFKSFEHRGDVFCELVEQLTKDNK